MRGGDCARSMMVALSGGGSLTAPLTPLMRVECVSFAETAMSACALALKSAHATAIAESLKPCIDALPFPHCQICERSCAAVRKV
jgi:hypothetical protein